MNRTRLLVLLGMLCGLSGCGIQEWWLGARRGVLFQGLDDVAAAGEPIELTTVLRGGRFLRPRSDYTVLYSLDGRFLGAAKTDLDGLARLRHTFPGPGVYSVEATLDPAELGDPDVPTATVVAGIFEPDQPFLLVDLDKTVVASGFDRVLLGRPEPMPHSRAVLQGLADRYQVLYLTQRPDYLVKRSRAWLRENGFPPGPLLVNAEEDGTFDNEAYKAGRIERIQAVFPRLAAGIGDKVSDMMAYRRHRIVPVLIVTTADLTPGQIRERAAALETLPPDVQVVDDWRNVPPALAGEAAFPPGPMAEKLREIADQEEERIRRRLEDQRDRERHGERPPPPAGQSATEPDPGERTAELAAPHPTSWPAVHPPDTPLPTEPAQAPAPGEEARP